jgi:hypothetical protein
MKRPVKKVKRFESGGYTGDDPIVKYRMGQASEADTYDALGQKDLADASRAKEPKKAAPTPAPKSTAPSDNFYGASSEKEIADASFKTPEAEKPKATPPKTTVRPAAPKAIFNKMESESYFNKSKGEKPPASDIDTMKSDVSIAKTAEDAKVSDKKIAENKLKRENAAKETKAKETKPIAKEDKNLSAADNAKIQRESIAGPDKNLKMPEPKSTGKKIREFFGSKYKSGGTVRTSASKRGDGIATKGHTRGKVC